MTHPPLSQAEQDDRDYDPVMAARVLSKVAWRLLPFLCLLYVFNILDRANLGFARLTMQKDLDFTTEAYQIGYGLFYVGYLFFEVPSNLLLHRVGARRWIARIMVTWGIVSACTMFVSGTAGFFAIRVLLGVAEAGFFPGIILYLTYWFPAKQRARVVSLFMVAIAFAQVLGNPVSGAIMYYADGVAGLKSWQWLFLLEGLPSVVLGVAVLFLLTDRPAQAAWLRPDERDWLTATVAAEEAARRARHGADRLKALLQPRVWLLIALYFPVAVGANVSGAEFPKMLERQFEDITKFQLGLLVALPHLCAVAAMVVIGAHSDRTGERRWHVAFSAAMGTAGWALAALNISPILTLTGLCVAQAGMMSMLPTFWAIPTAFLTGAASAGGVALINSVANIGGALGPWIYGQTGPWTVAGILFMAVPLALCVPREHVPEPGADDA